MGPYIYDNDMKALPDIIPCMERLRFLDIPQALIGTRIPIDPQQRVVPVRS